MAGNRNVDKDDEKDVSTIYTLGGNQIASTLGYAIPSKAN